MIEVVFWLFIGLGGGLPTNTPYVDSHPTQAECEMFIKGLIPGVNAPDDATVACVQVKASVKVLKPAVL